MLFEVCIVDRFGSVGVRLQDAKTLGASGDGVGGHVHVVEDFCVCCWSLPAKCGLGTAQGCDNSSRWGETRVISLRWEEWFPVKPAPVFRQVSTFFETLGLSV